MMRSPIVALALVAVAPVLAQPAPALAQQTAVAGKPGASAANALALELSIFVNSEDKIRHMIMNVVGGALEGGLKQDSNWSALEKEYPGLSAEAVAIILPIVLAEILKNLPAMQQEIADVYAKHLTIAEMRIFSDFMRSPLGVKFARSIHDGIDVSPMLKEQLEADGDRPVSGDAVRASVQSSVKGAVGKLTLQEKMAIEKFVVAIGVKKLAAVNNDATAVSMRWVNAPMPETDAEIEKAMTTLIERRVGGDKQ